MSKAEQHASVKWEFGNLMYSSSGIKTCGSNTCILFSYLLGIWASENL